MAEPLVLNHSQKGKERRRAEIASGRRHAIAEVSYSLGYSACSCGFTVEANESIRYLNARHQDLADRINEHIANANSRKAWRDEEDEE